ncbi:hypothetical protein Ddye_023031 [Dipteronia dyeriana]|uniref:Uncharacterized protein n=1 Tax=Dipteronia dyeriana TaxID=168575 RepID=A0AAD9WSV4_9ROSI|nr:hypothetical protein Ddye_023031 [Dipteronia dyeriana]
MWSSTPKGHCLSPSIGNLSFLRSICLDDNMFNVEIPHEVGRLYRLETLVLSDNYIPFQDKSLFLLGIFQLCSLPDSISNSSNLVEFDINVNNFKGRVSIDFSGLNNLKRVDMGKDNLGTGTTDDLGFLPF